MKENHSPMFDYICSFPRQLRAGYAIAQRVDVPAGSYKNVILCGMGGSAIGGDLIGGLAKTSMKIPCQVNRSYSLPNWVDEDTLAIMSSYSGNTGETLSCFTEAEKRGAALLAVTSGGRLEQECLDNDYPVVKIPGGMPPRAALGYSFSALYGVFTRLGFIAGGGETLAIAADFVEKTTTEFREQTRPPAVMAKELTNKVAVFYGDGFLHEAVISRFRCQLAENAKTIAFGNVFPELNHNEIVGWGLPEFTIHKFTAVFLTDEASDDKTAKQMKVTREILKSLGIETIDIEALGDNPLEKMLYLVHFADWLSYHLAVINEVDPIPIERIDLLKGKIKK